MDWVLTCAFGAGTFKARRGILKDLQMPMEIVQKRRYYRAMIYRRRRRCCCECFRQWSLSRMKSSMRGLGVEEESTDPRPFAAALHNHSHHQPPPLSRSNIGHNLPGLATSRPSALLCDPLCLSPWKNTDDGLRAPRSADHSRVQETESCSSDALHRRSNSPAIPAPLTLLLMEPCN